MSRDKAGARVTVDSHRHFVLEVEAEVAKIRKANDDDATKRRYHRKYRQRSLFPHLPADKAARILDVGCGSGSVLLLLREAGYTNLEGIDLCPENVALCRSAGLASASVHDALDLDSYGDPDTRWDLMSALDILEHMPSDLAVSFLRSIRKRLAKGGRALIQTPNMAYVLASWVRYADPTHTAGFTETSLTTVLRSAGFGRVEVFPVWHATTLLGYFREVYVRFLHKIVYLAEGAAAAKIASRGIIAVAYGD